MRRIVWTFLAAGAAALLSPAAAIAREPASDSSAKSAAPSFSPRELPLDRDGATLLTIPAPGRYSIRVKSPSGARIELVDMIAGPLDSAGAAGLRDGRIDALLDKGVYKVRLGAVKDARGAARFSAEPFVEAQAARPALVAGATQGGELADLQQRSYTLDVAAEGPAHLEAVGRALQDLRVFQADGALVDLAFERTTIETKPGRPMNRLRLDGALAPGRYVVTAYGGEKLVWADGAAQQPFLLRLADLPSLAAGVAEGTIGPFGSARFEAPASYDSFRLELPQPAPARLDARRGALRDAAAIARASRAPVATLRLAGDGAAPAQIDVTGYEGQAFVLRALRQSNRETFEGAGPHLVSVDVAGESGDEVPATALLARLEPDGRTRVIASDAPRIGAGKAWRGRFNVMGPTSLLFEATRDGPAAIDAKGVRLRAAIEPALGSLAPRADGKDPTRYDLPAGFYFLTLEPHGDAGGTVDVTLGPPGLAAPPPAARPPRASISFGEQALEAGGSYLILANAAPGLLTGPRVTALPVALDKAPLALHQPAGQEISLPLRLPKAGRVVARDARNGEVALAFGNEKTEGESRLVTVEIAAVDQPRALGLVHVQEPPAPERKEGAAREEAGKPLRAAPGRPAFLDLAKDETKSLRFEVAEGGLYRIETLGRLKTALRVGATVSPRLGEGEANGPGQNGRVTTFLRAGAYRAAVTARDSAGHLGLSVSPAALAPTAKIVDAGSAYATLSPGKGAVVPIAVTRAGDYRIELAGLGRDWRARLEDADGWPLTPPGPFRRETRRLEPGDYRLVVSPEEVEARMAARLTPVVAAPALEGHGPHPLPFEKAQKLQWREPPTRDAPRAPDVWRFALTGEADVELHIGAGMIGDILGTQGEVVGKVVRDRPFKGRLPAGAYRIEARSLAHDDRLDYDIRLSSKQLQPGAPRRVDLPASLDFALAQERVVDLASFGDRETIGVLKTAAGEVVERLAPRANDWNVALSRRLPAGAYRLELEALGPSREAVVAPAEETTQEDSEAASSDEGAEEGAEAAPASGVDVRLSILDEKDADGLAWDGEKALQGDMAQRLLLPEAPAGALVIFAARAPSEAAISIETQEADGNWRVVAVERGGAPVAAWPAPGDKSRWRATVWPVGGGADAVTVAARVIERRARAPGDVAFEPLSDLTPALCVAKVGTPDAALVALTAPSGIVAGSAPGRPLRAASSGALAPQAQALWLLSRDCRARAKVSAFEWLGEEVALDLGEGERAQLPAGGAPRGRMRLWLARSTFAQPAIGGRKDSAMALAPGAAMAVAGDEPPEIWNASGPGPLRVSVSAVDVETRPPLAGGAVYSGVAEPFSAVAVDMEKSERPLAVDLAAGLAVFAGPRAVLADGASVSRLIHGAGERALVVNPTAAPLPFRLARGADPAMALGEKNAFKRFFGAAGQISLPLGAEKGDRLVVIGAEATVVSQSGGAQSGGELTLDGPGELILDYRPGLVAAWLERKGAAPWPQAAARPLAPPQRVALEGPAMRFTLARETPALISASSGAPAFVAFTQNGKRETFAFPAGVEFRHYMAAGEATLDLYAPHDGALSGGLDVAAQPAIEAHEGVNDAIAVAPGATTVFSFETKREGEIGLGVRADPDRVAVRLLDASGKTLGEGAAQLVRLKPGRYFIEARVPADARASVIRAAIVGLSPPSAAPPEEVVADLLEKAGLKKSK